MRRIAVFTLIELLVVVAIISVLLAILLPGLKNAKESAKRISEVSARKQLTVACHVYASDNDGVIPYRGAGELLLHKLVSNDLKHDINKSLLQNYFGNMSVQEVRDKIMFCQSSLWDVRNQTSAIYNGDYAYNPPSYPGKSMTLNYFRQPWVDANASGGSRWRVTPFDISRLATTKGLYPMWSCAFLRKNDDIWFGHNAPVTKAFPQGGCTSYTDGSAEWVPFRDFVYMYYGYATDGAIRYYVPERGGITGVQYRVPGP